MSAARPGHSDPPARSTLALRPDSSRRRGPDASWISREVDAMAAAWSRGQRVSAGEVIDRHPGLDDEAAVRLIYEEVGLRREAGEDVHTTEVIGRYPRWKDELEVLLGCDRMLRPLAGVAHLPEVGEQLGPFQLRAELGRGASGKTYLASEPTLADRPVVLKVISSDQEEHLSLARLRHTNIIPLFSEHSFPERGLRALCMPYLGGTSLARILEGLAAIPPADRRGRDIIHVLDRAQAADAEPAPQDGPYRDNIERAPYVEAICWIGTRLADALQEAHAHGLVHMDVKPSNVLITADGAPMLLDFHLACRPIAAGERFPDRIGGTPGWMAPEHRAALDAVAGGEPVPEPVDQRADLYALGLLLRDALGGAAAAGAGALRRCNPAVSNGLESIIRKCLADRPADRYPTAVALADDLRLHLDHRPLRGVPNRLGERLRKRWRRGPAAIGRVAAVISMVLISAAIALFWAAAVLRAGEVRADLQEGLGLCRAGRYGDAEFPLRRGLDLAEIFPRRGDLAAAIDKQLRIAHRGQKAESLHKLAEQVRFRYGVDPPAGSEAEALRHHVQAIWDDRHLLISRESAPLDAELEEQIRADLLELVGAWAELRIRPGPVGETRAAAEETLAIFDEASAAFGASSAIDRVRRSLAERLGRAVPAPAAEDVPRSAFDHYDLGRSLLRKAEYAAAAKQFQLCLDRNPKDFWPYFYLGLCEFRLGHYEVSESAFGTCIALAPPRSEPECYYNRAMAAEARKQSGDALHDYSQALDRDPGFTAARLNRGILLFNMGRHADAISDLRRALGTAHERAIRGRIYYNLALVELAAGDRPSARASAEHAIELGEEDAWSLHDRLRGAR